MLPVGWPERAREGGRERRVGGWVGGWEGGWRVCGSLTGREGRRLENV